MNILPAISILSRFTNSAVISPGDTYFGDSGTLFGRLTAVNTPAEFGLSEEIANFQRMLTLFGDDPKIELESYKLKLTSSEDTTITGNFLTSDISLIKRDDFNFEDQFKKTVGAPKVLEVTLSEELVHKIKVASGIIDNSRIVLHVEDSSSPSQTLTLTIKDTDYLASDSHSASFTIKGDDLETCIKDFKITADPSIFSKMPKCSSMKLSVVYSERVGSFRILLSAEIPSEGATVDVVISTL